MTQYRIYLLIAASGRIHSAGNIEAPSDAHAVQIANELMEEKSVEVWHGERRIYRREAANSGILERHRAHQAERELAAAGDANSRLSGSPKLMG